MCADINRRRVEGALGGIPKFGLRRATSSPPPHTRPPFPGRARVLAISTTQYAELEPAPLQTTAEAEALFELKGTEVCALCRDRGRLLEFTMGGGSARRKLSTKIIAAMRRGSWPLTRFNGWRPLVAGCCLSTVFRCCGGPCPSVHVTGHQVRDASVFVAPRCERRSFGALRLLNPEHDDEGAARKSNAPVGMLRG